MDEMFARFIDNLTGRWSGPLHFRLLIQPTVATILAVRDGLKDARLDRPPYFWAIFTRADERRQMLRDGWKAVAKVFVLALVLDVIYQLIVVKWVYPGEALVTAAILALLPYLLIRGPVGRIARHWVSRKPASGA
jgi:hypothetical protein